MASVKVWKKLYKEYSDIETKIDKALGTKKVDAKMYLQLIGKKMSLEEKIKRTKDPKVS